MKKYSIFNDVLGPVMHGPSSSHTAAAHRLGRLAQAALGTRPTTATIIFDRHGSFGQVFRDQGSDLAFAAGLMDWDITDDRFFQALILAPGQGLQLQFILADIPQDRHPNAVIIDVKGDDGSKLTISARSIGGGSIEIIRVDDWPTTITGQAHELLILAEVNVESQLLDLIYPDPLLSGTLDLERRDGQIMIRIGRLSPWPRILVKKVKAISGVNKVCLIPPGSYVPLGPVVFASGQEMIGLAESRGWSLGRTALHYEAELLGMSETDILEEMSRRLSVMEQAVQAGLYDPDGLRPMRLLTPTAHHIYQAEAAGRLALGGVPTRAAARAMAALHVNSGMGLVCAAPTGGSSGVLPGVAVTLLKDMSFGREQVLMALMAAAAIGLVILMRGDTYAAEVAGCQVEIGAAGAMAAAGVVEAVGGPAAQAADAAAIALQNTMGMPCDLVQGAVEIPCHTRNALAASSAFICADLILGGYINHISLDDSVDASLAVGRVLPPELRCTAKGGVAVTPSALALSKTG